jgi:hypothetical protein
VDWRRWLYHSLILTTKIVVASPILTQVLIILFAAILARLITVVSPHLLEFPSRLEATALAETSPAATAKAIAKAPAIVIRHVTKLICRPARRLTATLPVIPVVHLTIHCVELLTTVTRSLCLSHHVALASSLRC